MARPAAAFLSALTGHPSATPALAAPVSAFAGADPLADGGSAFEQHGSEEPPALDDAASFVLAPPSAAPLPIALPFGEAAARVETNGNGCSRAASEPVDAGEAMGEPTLHGLASLKPLGQLRESFILAVNEEGLWIIDQHVAHERILFEKVLRERQVERVEQQRLLMPMLIDLLPAQMVAFAGIARELEKNGLEVEPFGPRTIAIKAAPAGLEGRELERMLIEVLEEAAREEQAENLEAARQRIAASIACHAAIKVNTPLDTAHIEWLLAELAKTSHPTSCPHGRPIALRYAWKEIQRAFQRI
jgi:DNA mismatch repair protein MutL